MERNLRILHLSESSGWSGGAAQALALASRLQELGHENMIACPEGGDLWRKAAAAGMRTSRFRPRRDYDLPCAFALARTIAAWKPDLVHAHHPKAHAMGLLAKAFSFRRPALVVTRRVSHPLLRTFFARRKYKSPLVDGYIAVADSIRALILEYGLPPGKVRTIYSGVDPSRFHPVPPSDRIRRELSLPPGVPVIGLVGNFSFDKGQHVCAEAAARLVREGRKVVLVFAGRDTDSPAAAELLSQKGFPPGGARLLGLRDDVPDILSVLTVSLNCAVKGEALSGSMRESLAMGIPVIASDISGNGELVRDRETGLLFPPGDDEALYGRLGYALSNPGEMRETAARGLASVRENFTVEAMARKTFLYYRELLERK